MYGLYYMIHKSSWVVIKRTSIQEKGWQVQLGFTGRKNPLFIGRVFEEEK